LISHDFNLISTDFSMRCTRFLLLPTPRCSYLFKSRWSTGDGCFIPSLA